MTHRFTERLFGGVGKHSLTTPKRPGTGRRAWRKTTPLQPNELRNDERGRR